MTFTALAFQEEQLWVAQLVERDICVQAMAVGDLPRKLRRAVLSNIAVNEHLGKCGLDGVPATPTAVVERMKGQGALKLVVTV